MQNLWFAVLPLMILFGVGMGVRRLAALDRGDDGGRGRRYRHRFGRQQRRCARRRPVRRRDDGRGRRRRVRAVRSAGFAEAGTVFFGQIPEGAASDPAVEAARVAATNAAFAAVAYITAALSLMSAVIAWLTLEKRLGGKPKAAAGKA